MTVQESGFAFASAQDIPVPYIDRSRSYYLAMGYPKPYVWAHMAEVPFAPLEKPLNQCSISVITTASPIEEDRGDQGPGARMNPAAMRTEVYSEPAHEPPALGISHLHYDRAHTDGSDRGALVPLRALADAAEAGRIGSLSPRFHGVPTRYSHRLSLKKDAPELLRRLREDGSDLVLLPAI